METKTTIIDNILQNRVLTHVLFWLGVVVSYPIMATAFNQSIYVSLVLKLLFLPPQIIAAYLLIYYQIPQLILKKKYVSFILSIIVSTYVLSVASHFLNDYGVIPILGWDQQPDSVFDILFGFQEASSFYIVWLYLPPMIMASIKLVKQRYEGKQRFETLQKEKVQAELNMLKAQIHPRFLSNTLQNLYQLSLQKSDHAPEVVAKLSEMLDYMLYQSHTPTVLLSKEIELMQTFLELETFRYGDQLEVSFQQQIATDISIAPLLLLSILENVCTYPSTEKNDAIKIQMLLKVIDQNLHFDITKTHSKLLSPTSANDEEANIRRQLTLIYPNQHHYVVEQTAHAYHVNLNLTL